MTERHGNVATGVLLKVFDDLALVLGFENQIENDWNGGHEIATYSWPNT